MGMKLQRRMVLAGLGSTAFTQALKAAAPSRPVVRTNYGQVEGFTQNGASLFLGIPYGAPTGGQWRFLPPRRPQPWQGIRDATQLGQRAPQMAPPIYTVGEFGSYMVGGREAELIAMREPMGEDNLVLNITTPAADNARRPVLVYLHGGAFAAGCGTNMILTERLVKEEDIVTVSLNHRLSALGYLNLGDLSDKYADGNVGMLDLVAALEWIRDNIAAFGGDPEKVTIYGESGGGAKVCLLMAMSQARGLFRGAIIESADMVRPAPYDPDAVVAALKDIGISPGNLGALASVPVETMLKVMPTVRPQIDRHSLLPGTWETAPAQSADIPLVVGYCAHEVSLDYWGGRDDTRFHLDWDGAAGQLAKVMNKPRDRVATVLDAYRSATGSVDPVENLFRVQSEVARGLSVMRIAAVKAVQRAPVYFYRTEYDTRIAPGLRAFHCAELPLAGRMVKQPRSEALSRQIGGAWAAFARTGNPNHAGLPEWMPVQDSPLGMMMFGEASRFEVDPISKVRPLLTALVGPTGTRILGG